MNGSEAQIHTRIHRQKAQSFALRPVYDVRAPYQMNMFEDGNSDITMLANRCSNHCVCVCMCVARFSFAIAVAHRPFN